MTIALTSRTIRALITKRNRPKVMMVIGQVNITITGLINAFTIPIRKAAKKAGPNPLTVTPGKIKAVIITAIALTIRDIK